MNIETIFMCKDNSKSNDLHKSVLNLSKRLDFRISDKHVALQNVSIHCLWKNIRKQYKNNKLKMIGSTWNDEFEVLLDGSKSIGNYKCLKQ